MLQKSIFRQAETKTNKGANFTDFLKQAMIEEPCYSYSSSVPACTRAGVHTSALLHGAVSERCCSLTRAADTDYQSTQVKWERETAQV